MIYEPKVSGGLAFVLKSILSFHCFLWKEAMNISKRGIQPSSDGQFQLYEIFHGLREHHVCPGWLKKLI